MKDDVKIHMKHIKRVRSQAEIKEFIFWPSSSLDLNSIEKI